MYLVKMGLPQLNSLGTSLVKGISQFREQALLSPKQSGKMGKEINTCYSTMSSGREGSKIKYVTMVIAKSTALG